VCACDSRVRVARGSGVVLDASIRTTSGLRVSDGATTRGGCDDDDAVVDVRRGRLAMAGGMDDFSARACACARGWCRRRVGES